MRDPVMPKATTDHELRSMGWFDGKFHPVTGDPLEIVALDLPPVSDPSATATHTIGPALGLFLAHIYIRRYLVLARHCWT